MTDLGALMKELEAIIPGPSREHRNEDEMTEFEKAMVDYEDNFGQCYPCAIGIGFPGSTDEENIRIIRECIEKNTPVDFEPDYRPGCIY